MGDEIIHIDRACRVCLREEGEMKPLFSKDLNDQQDCGLGLNEMLSSSAQIEVLQNDGLPYQICSECECKLSSTYTFKQLCRISDAKLRRYIGKRSSVTKLNKDIKLENIAQTTVQISTPKNNAIDYNKTLEDVKTEVTEVQENVQNDKNNKSINNTKKEQITCTECNKSYTRPGHHRRHMFDAHGIVVDETEKKDQPLVCLVCEKAFQEFEIFKKHMQVKHGKKKLYNCTICQEGFNKQDNYLDHVNQCKLYCALCEEQFENAESLHSHIKTEHHNHDANGDMSVEIKVKEIKLEDTPETSEGKKSDLPNSDEDESRADENSFPLEESSAPFMYPNMDMSYQNLNVKEEPLEDLLEEAERENNLLGRDVDNITQALLAADDDITSVGRLSEGFASDTSEFLPLTIKKKRKVGRPRKRVMPVVKKDNLKSYEGENGVDKHCCSKCPKMFSSEIGLKIHIGRHNSKRPFKCTICRKSFSTAKFLKRHEFTHATNKLFKCETCHKLFSREGYLQRHMWLHAENKPIVCEICNKTFKRDDQLERHKVNVHSNKEKNNKTAECEICKREFSERYLDTHMRMHTGDKTFTCKVCEKSFNSKWHLKEHAKWHSAEKPFLCSECGQRFIRNDYLVIHMRRHKGEKPYKCPFCGKGFPRATDLTVHERYHTGEKTHLCTICGKGFQRQYNLTVHLRVHTGEKPYVCSYCGKRFAQGNDLKSHVRRHTGERYNCEVCGEGFIQGYHLTQHKRHVHGIDCTSHIRRVKKYPVTNLQNDDETILQKVMENGDKTRQLVAQVAAQLQGAPDDESASERKATYNIQVLQSGLPSLLPIATAVPLHLLPKSE